MRMKSKREESDFLGSVLIDNKVYWGSQTQRALENYPFQNPKQHSEYIYATTLIKKAAAIVNQNLGLLDQKRSRLIIAASEEILHGKLSGNFILSPYQAGAGTSHNMNINEVIANRANELAGFPLGSYRFIHPNDHVNMSQSTNDIIPASIRIASLHLLPELFSKVQNLAKNFYKKGDEFANIIKSGRTHLCDALPVTLGQEFHAYAVAIEKDRKRIFQASKNLYFIGIGGTAVGTGINTHPNYHEMMVGTLSKITGLKLKSSKNLSDPMQNTADFLDVSSSLKILAQNLVRIGNDLRLLSSGPGTSMHEISLPAVQPGSSIMPGKTNPSIVEMLTMVCYQVMGFDQAILFAGMSGQLELNVMFPLIAYDLLEQIKLLTPAINIFIDKCLNGITANEENCRFWMERGSGLGAILNPVLGYHKSALLVQEARQKQISVRTLAVKKGLLTRKQAEKLFSLKNLTRPNIGI